MNTSGLSSKAALSVLMVLQLTMLGALYTQTSPHPPLTVPPFALGPFIGASLALAAAAYVLGGAVSRHGTAVTCAAALTALVSYGPQKWLDPAIAEIWPAVLLGELAVAVILWSSVRGLRASSGG